MLDLPEELFSNHRSALTRSCVFIFALNVLICPLPLEAGQKSNRIRVSTVAGVGRAVDGKGTAATFHSPYGVAADSAGNVYVADSWNSRIRKISPNGTVTTYAGAAGFAIPSTKDGPAKRATFRQPEGIAVDRKGNVYVADTWDNKIRKISKNRTVTTLAGTGAKGAQDGEGNQATFDHPTGITVDDSGVIYVADRNNNKIRKITPDGYVTTLAGSGEGGAANGQGEEATFSSPEGVTVDHNRNVFVADTDNYLIRKISYSGVVTTVSGSGHWASIDGYGTEASYSGPSGITIDRSGNLYITDSKTDKIRKITPNGLVTTFAGSGNRGSNDGISSSASFSYPYGITVDSQGNLFVADVNNDKIRKISPQGVVSTFAGIGHSMDGAWNKANFSYLDQIDVDPNGNIYAVDMHKIRKISTDGNISTLAGSGEWESIDGIGKEASFTFLKGIIISQDGTIYVTDFDIPKVRKITAQGVVSTLAGSSNGSADGMGSEASFSYKLAHLAEDIYGNLYVADGENNKIRKITPAGLVTTFAGSGVAGSNDGVGSEATFSAPYGIAVDRNGTVFVADGGNHKIRKISPAGNVSTFAGSGSSGSIDGFGLGASFTHPAGIALDSLGNLYVCDAGSHKIRKISPAAAVTTIAGTGSAGYKNGPGSVSSFYFPLGIAVDASDNLYVSEMGNLRIRKITFIK
jgi:sugar lactone lactonase YvrE